MRKLFILLFIFVTHNLWAVCTSPISRTNTSSGQVLTSTKYNLDLNTVYSKINDLPGDCITDATVSTAKIADGAVTSAKLAAGVLSQFIPAGTILPFGGTVAPSGFLLCNGQTVSRTDYSDLYAAIGDNFGNGNGSTTFHVPDLRGRFLRGVDSGVGNDPDRATRTAMNSGGNIGDNVGSVQDDAFESHSHRVKNADSVAGGPGTSGYVAGSTFNSWQSNAENTGGNETRPKNANVNFIIKY